jgi:poly(3-hydroxyalkanoate) synthetase
VPPDLVLDYVHGAVQKVLETSGAEEISLFGQSQGGTLCAMYASLFPEGPLKNLILLSAPTEFASRNPGPSGSGRSRAAAAVRISIR